MILRTDESHQLAKSWVFARKRVYLDGYLFLIGLSGGCSPSPFDNNQCLDNGIIIIINCVRIAASAAAAECAYLGKRHSTDFSYSVVVVVVFACLPTHRPRPRTGYVLPIYRPPANHSQIAISRSALGTSYLPMMTSSWCITIENTACYDNNFINYYDSRGYITISGF